ncbi:hypothetical protein SAMN05660772_02344 [Pasteurella testudinis DSM 23072]|uniref:Tandem five-TM protein n=1 Tax=Pasteurella testudinis DSM 23072 TaxID=1122938 RepID=A0A1W1UVH4_9PAST|nr:hypothetical protein [Pasteurella testudinis]SMB84791.1 hypothetical protein SAMN05660772_02344 [Pasteurella testudinis DSM 23072]SUB51269.1 Uncharacterised protein [Pasteurella testudinis]
MKNHIIIIVENGYATYWDSAKNKFYRSYVGLRKFNNGKHYIIVVISLHFLKQIDDFLNTAVRNYFLFWTVGTLSVIGLFSILFNVFYTRVTSKINLLSIEEDFITHEFYNKFKSRIKIILISMLIFISLFLVFIILSWNVKSIALLFCAWACLCCSIMIFQGANFIGLYRFYQKYLKNYD